MSERPLLGKDIKNKNITAKQPPLPAPLWLSQPLSRTRSGKSPHSVYSNSYFPFLLFFSLWLPDGISSKKGTVATGPSNFYFHPPFLSNRLDWIGGKE